MAYDLLLFLSKVKIEIMRYLISILVIFSVLAAFFFWATGSDFFNFTKEITIESSKTDYQKPENASSTNTSKRFQKKTFRLTCVGDIMLSREVANKINTYGANYPFSETASTTNKADLVFGNLETAIFEGRRIQSGEMKFRSDPKAVQGLKFANFNILSLANNHTYNFGEKRLVDTLYHLKQEDISYVGAGTDKEQAHTPQIKEIKGIRIAFLGYVESSFTENQAQARKEKAGIAFMDKKQAKKDIKKAERTADLTVVSMHAGKEYQKKPTSKQIDFAYSAIDAGADLIIGHHPHVVQKAEKYRGKYIFYSLGNFIFDQMWSEETREGVMVNFEVSENRIRPEKIIPVFIENYSQPRELPESSKRYKKIMETINIEA
jgi:poly-gamma-glutamate synthesis protein (capsule biosynthesis protein)